MITRRTFLTAASALSAGVSLGVAACSTETVVPVIESRTVTVAMPDNVAYEGVSYDAPALTVRRLLAEPTEGDGGFTLHVLPVRGWQLRSYDDRPLHALMAGNPPDIALAPAHSIGPLARAGHIAPVSQFMERSEEDLWTGDALVAGARSLGLVRGQRWALPLTGVPMALLCRIDLIKEAGYEHLLETPRSLTWEQFREFARALTRRSGGEGVDQWGLDLAPYAFPHLAMWIWQNGGEFFDQATFQTLPVTAESTEALDFLLTLTRTDRVSPYLDHSHVHWEAIHGALRAPALSTDGGPSGPPVPVSAWVAPARQQFYTTGHASLKRTLGLAQLPHNRRRAGQILPTALLAVSSAAALDPALRQAIRHVTGVLESDAGFGLPLRRAALQTWAEERVQEAGDENTARNVQQAVAALEDARTEYAHGTFDLVWEFDLRFPVTLISALSSHPKGKIDTQWLLTQGLAALDAYLNQRCGPDGCRAFWEGK